MEKFIMANRHCRLPWEPQSKNADRDISHIDEACISHNVCFLLDVRNMASKNDRKSDNMGLWKNSVQCHRYHVGQDEDFILKNDDNSKKGGQPLIMKQIYYKNNSSPDVKKIVSLLEGMYYIIVQVFFAFF
jgi:hypothetical protein